MKYASIETFSRIKPTPINDVDQYTLKEVGFSIVKKFKIAKKRIRNAMGIIRVAGWVSASLPQIGIEMMFKTRVNTAMAPKIR